MSSTLYYVIIFLIYHYHNLFLPHIYSFFFFNDTATTEIYTLSLHDALPMSDPGKYRTRAEIEKYQERDPIKIFTKTLKDNGILNDSDIAEIEAQVKEEVEKAVRFADESPLPDPKELYTDIYANPIN